MKTIRRMILMLVVLISGTVHSASAAPISALSVETCEAQPSPGWVRSGNVRTADGVCMLNEGQLGLKDRLLDFSLHFRFRLDQDSIISIGFSKSVWDSYELTLSPSEARLTRFQGNNRSSHVDETRVRLAKVFIPPGAWVEAEFRLEGDKQILLLDEAEIWTQNFVRLDTNLSVGGKNEAQVDDLQVEQLDLSVSGQSLASFTPELSTTWIAFESLAHDSLWIVHPDGTGKTQVATDAESGWGISYKFSPDGKTLAVYRAGEQQGFISFLDLETLQPVGELIITAQQAQFDWLPDSHQVVILNSGQAGKDDFLIAEIQTGNIVRRVPIPTATRQGELQINHVSDPVCSPNQDVLLLSVSGEPQGTTFTHVLFDLTAETVDLLPWGGDFTWSPDGNYLFAGAGGLVEKNTLKFKELPAGLVDASNTWGGGWSPNGQFIAGKIEETIQEIIDLHAERKFSLPASAFGGWSPDSQHIVYSDLGRILVMNVVDAANQQIALGYNPSWGPAPEIASQSGWVSFESTPSPTEISSVTPESQAQIVQTQPSETQPAAATPLPPGDFTEPAGPQGGLGLGNLIFAILALIGFSGLVVSVLWVVLSRRVTCQNCRRSNPVGAIVCMYCGTAIRKDQRRITPAWIGLGLSLLCLLPGAVGLLANRGKEIPAGASTQLVQGLKLTPQAAEPAMLPKGTSLVQSETVVDPTVPQSYLCEGVALRSVTLRQLLRDSYLYGQKGEAAFNELMMLSQTPTPDAARVTQVVSEVERFCQVSDISFSPDGLKILVRLTDAHGQKLALFRAQQGSLSWVLPLQNTVPRERWSPDSSRLLLVSSQGSSVLDAASGEQLSFIPASARRGANCELEPVPNLNNGDEITWMGDSRSLVRKIDNAVQILDSSTSESLQEVPVDDALLGTTTSEGMWRCRYSLIWSPDGSRFATLGSFTVQEQNQPVHYLIRLWQTADAARLWEAAVPGSYSEDAVWSPDGNWILFSSSYADPLTLLDAGTGQPASVIPLPPEAKNRSRYFWSPDNQMIAYQGDDSVYWYDVASQVWSQSALLEAAQGGYLQSWLPQGQMMIVRNEMFYSEFWMLEPSSQAWTSLRDSASVGR